MGQAKREWQEQQERNEAIEAIGVEVKGLVHDEGADETASADDEEAEKDFYACVFRAWADGIISGTADEIFEDIKSALSV